MGNQASTVSASPPSADSSPQKTSGNPAAEEKHYESSKADKHVAKPYDSVGPKTNSNGSSASAQEAQTPTPSKPGQINRAPSFFRTIAPSSDGSATSLSPQSLQVMQKGLVDADITRILVLYCGGTIGMKKDRVKGYMPLKNYLSSFLRSHDRFHDAEHLEALLGRSSSNHYGVHSMDTSLGDILLLPHFVDGQKRVAYQIHELDVLKDSSNMVEADYISLAAIIQKHYHSYDGFLVLHGTDTMAYTASALSFLLEDLGKSVIMTGSQVPFTELRNDAYENFLGSLILCSHYCIPEVTVYFNNKLFRGNRVKKVNSQAFAAFNSPNMKPLGRMGVEIHLEWGKIQRAASLRPFRASRALHASVVCLRLFPGITAATIRAITSEPVRGLVLETYGSGNAPDDNPSLLAALADAVKRGVVIVNVTQCTTGAAVAGYAVGYALSATGVISGRDMTVECALMKLNYLLSHPEHSQLTVTRLMGESLRGELTAEDAVPVGMAQDGSGKPPPGTLSSLIMETSLAACAEEALRDKVDALLRPLLLHDASSRGDLSALEELISLNYDINTTSRSSGRTCLYVAISRNSVETVRWLILHGVNVHLRDKFGVTALVYAIRLLVFTDDIQRTVDCICLLKEAGSSLCSMCLTEELMNFAHVGNVSIIKMIFECGGSLDCADRSGKTLLHIAVLHGQVEVISWCCSKPELQFLFAKRDRSKRRAVDEAQALLQAGDSGLAIGLLKQMVVALQMGEEGVSKS